MSILMIKMNHPHGVMNAYIQNVSYCKRSIRDMKTYQKKRKWCDDL